MIDDLLNFISRMGHWGYFLIFLAAMLESGAFLGLLVPGETVVLFAGFLSAQSILDLDVLMFIVTIAAIFGDNLSYFIGHRLGNAWVVQHGHWIGVNIERYERSKFFFQRHGNKAVLIGRFMSFTRALIPFIAGTVHMRYSRFFVFDSIGACLWSVCFLLLGYFLGGSWKLVEHWLGNASAILGGTLILILLLLWLWQGLVRYEKAIKDTWSNFRQSPMAIALQKKLSPLFQWIKKRISPGAYLGLELTIGVIIFIVAAWLFGVIAEDVVTSDPLTQIDKIISIWLYEHKTQPLITFMEFISDVNGALPILTLTLLLTLFFLWKRSWYQLLTLILLIPGGMLLNVLLKLIFHRQRPLTAVDSNMTTYSFPSGHTMAATIFYGYIAALIISQLKSWKWRVLVGIITVMLILLVGFSRMYLGVHYLSDVLAAIAEGIAWLALCFTAVNTMKQRQVCRSN